MTAWDRRDAKLEKPSIMLFTITQSKDYVQEIIDLADVGRSTFYSHYESKELLLDELCQEALSPPL